MIKLPFNRVALSAHMDRVELGQKMLSMMWRNLAEKVVLKAIEVYGLDFEQGEALKSAFLYRTLGNVVPG